MQCREAPEKHTYILDGGQIKSPKLEFGLTLACAWVPYAGVAHFPVYFFTQWTPYIQVFVLGEVRVHSL